MNNKKTPVVQDGFSEASASAVSGIISFFLLILTTVFPLIYHNSYIDILETKYRCLYMTILGMLIVLLVVSLVLLFIDCKEWDGEHAKQLFSALHPKNWKEHFCSADGAVFVFWLLAGISTLQSEYLYEAFWGNEGRYSGFFLITLYVASYFVISRFWTLKGWIVQAFLISGLIMCYVGITDYFQLDVLDFRGSIKPEQSTIFTSTVGNINTYTAYVGILMGLSAAMFATEKTWWKAIWYYICMTVTFFAIIMGCSDNAYLALGALFAFLPFLLFRSREGILRYLMIVSTFVTVIQCIDWLNQSFGDMVIGLDSLFRILVNVPWLFAAAALCWIVTAVFYFFCKRAGGEEKPLGRRFVAAWAAFLMLCAAGIVFLLVDANALGHGERYGALGQYLVFDDSWGTYRGYIWKKSLELYAKLPLLHKLFGFGPDTFGILTTESIQVDMIQATGQIYDNAHNAYLQYLLTVGLTGVAAYVTFHVSALWRMMKTWKRNPYVIGCLFGVLCYDFQALVNLDLPIATPMMWLLLAAGMAAAGKKKRSAEEN